MPHRDRWIHERDRERDRRRADYDRPEDDYGQADYSTDYGYDPRTRTGYRAHEGEDFDDYGQADYSEDFASDDESRTGYRRDDPRMRHAHDDERRGDWRYAGDRRRGDRDERRERDWHFADERRRGDYRDRYDEERGEPRSWLDQARDSVSGFLGGAAGASAADRAARQHRRDRVIWAVITGRLDHERSLDASHIEVLVQGSEVTLNGEVRSRDEKRLAEDLADVRGVTHVQNNLRIRRSWWR